MEKDEGQARTDAAFQELKKQITVGCGETSCIGIFCKIPDVHSVVEEVARVLAEFGDTFTCRSIYVMNGKVLYRMESERRVEESRNFHSQEHLDRMVVGESNSGESVETQRKGGAITFGSSFMERDEGLDGPRCILEYILEGLKVRDAGWREATSTVPASPIKRELRSRRMHELSRVLSFLMHGSKTRTAIVILQGLFYHEMNKISFSYSPQTITRAIKLFNSVKDVVKFEKRYFVKFLASLQRINSGKSAEIRVCTSKCDRRPGGHNHKRAYECNYREEEEFPLRAGLHTFRTGPPSGADEPGGRRCGLCTHAIELGLEEEEALFCEAMCFLSAELCVNDLVDLIKSLTVVVDNLNIANIRESSLLEKIMQTLKVIYDFSVGNGLVHHSIFVNKRFSRMLNYKLEVRFHKEGAASILDYPFVLDMEAKGDLVQIENTDKMKIELQDAFFRSLFEGKVSPYLNFEVGRESVVEDALRLFQGLEKGKIRKQLKIKFVGEEGVDSGGIRKEFFQLLSQRLFENWDLFEETDGYLWIKKVSQKEKAARRKDYRVLGSILGIAAYNGAVLNLCFPHVFYKKLLGAETTLEDLRQVDPGLYKTLTGLESMSASEVENLCLEFLRAGTSDEPRRVTKSNANEFVESYCKEVLNASVREEFESIKEGLWEVCEGSFVSSLLPCELEVLIGGMECQDLEEMEKYTMYNGYKKDSPIVRYFWEIFRAYDRKMQKKFLRFVTGSDRAPSGGISRMAIIFMRNGGDTDRLPSSQTCFNTILVPEYSSKRKLEEKLGIAVNYTEGFFLL